ncbi:hypothetical protein [Nocardioides mangrovi]|uniref:DUF2993 domain-containing protein n=1 Tax=Nocardioides mangrovi TaxID=2874580 RepID=A0ABS7U9M2_9ACTN|nr:hypothetical protein [Nocardioides mangrovi]MBZ5737679.1 hypothetical protein [Nocardioides mangrovi]
MRGLGLALTLAALLVIGGAVAAVLLGTVWRRRRAAYVVGAAALTLGFALEVVPRVVLHRELRPSCLEGSVPVTFAGGSVTWQALTGGPEVRAVLGAAEVEDLVADRLAGGPLDDVSVELAADAVEVGADIGTPMGALPLVVTVRPEVTDGALSFEPVAGEVAGRELPARILDRLTGAGGSGSGCGAGMGGMGDGRVVAADVDPDGLALTLRW